MKIGIDIMGGDYAPKRTIHGAILAYKELPKNIRIVLFGKKKEILAELNHHEFASNKFEIIDCSEVISMGDHPTKTFRAKTDSSISKGFEYLAINSLTLRVIFSLMAIYLSYLMIQKKYKYMIYKLFYNERKTQTNRGLHELI